MKKKLRYYQAECLNEIEKRKSGKYLIQMCCGAGKTFTFSKIKRQGRVLLLAHRKELLDQAAEEYDCPKGFEQGDRKSNGEEVIFASSQSLVNRLKNFKPDEFDLIILDESHRATTKTNEKILEYFKPRMLLGFTATPNRSDGKGLDSVFEDIIYEYPIEQAMKDKNLVNIECKRVKLDFDLDGIKKSGDDYNLSDLFERMKGTEKGIAEAYRNLSRGQTIIFGVNVEHCYKIQEEIPGSVVVDGKTKEREQIVQDFKDGKIKCLINCMVYTEGTNIPCIETVIWARPTQSEVLYTQGVMRGARLHPGKESMLLIDCVDASAKNSLCTAPTLIGIDIDDIKPSKKSDIEGDIFDLPEIIENAGDTPAQWIQNVKTFNMWARKKKYKTHGVNYFKYPDGRMRVCLPKQNYIEVSTPDSLQRSFVKYTGRNVGERMSVQRAFDFVYKVLNENYNSCEPIWNLGIIKKWGKHKATDKQMAIIRSKMPGCRHLTKLEASQILNRIM